MYTCRQGLATTPECHHVRKHFSKVNAVGHEPFSKMNAVVQWSRASCRVCIIIKLPN
jgi:hypothetical protein